VRLPPRFGIGRIQWVGEGSITEGFRSRWRLARQASRRHVEVFGRRPRLLLLRTHSERIHRTKVFQRDPRLPVLADKIEVKSYLADRVGPEYVVPTLFSGDALPPRRERTWDRPFFVKAAHGSGWQVRVSDDGPPRWGKVERNVDAWLSTTYGENGGEWHYGRMPRRILVEPHLGDIERWPDDYKVWVFHGRVHFVHWLTARNTPEHGGRYLDRDWSPVGFRSLKYPTHPLVPPRPRSWDTMLWIAERIGQEFAFVRVDMYEVDGHPYVGELTFTPTAGYHRLDPPETDLMLGRLWRKPRRRLPAAPYPGPLRASERVRVDP
jgi:TupA-like ATPgrasp